MVLGSLALACSNSTLSEGGGTGGSTSSSGGAATGGTTGSGGDTGTGGRQGSGGSSVGSGGNGSGGTVSGSGGRGSGGVSSSTGGNTDTGGAASGGASGSGGRGRRDAGVSMGGNTAASGGATSGPGGSGGATSPVGGSAAGGRQGAGGTGPGAGGRTGAGGENTGGQTTGGSTGTSTDPVKSDGCGKATTAKTGNGQTISVNGSNRTYNLKLPDSYDMNKAYRLIVAYHWLNGTANNVTSDNYYGLWSLSQNSTVFVAPQGINNGWSNSGGGDVEFSRQLITQLESQICIDKSRIFCEGFSMGGSMSYAMACAMGDSIRAVAVHSGGAMSGCVSHNKPVAYFMTHGTQDSVCTYPGYGVPQLQDFAKVDGCKSPDPTLNATQFEAALPNPTSSAAACIDFTGCQAGYPVRSCLFVGDHTWNPAGWTPGETWKFISQF
jgi:poly(3-hydroxybutyrate) depolymerase